MYKNWIEIHKRNKSINSSFEYEIFSNDFLIVLNAFFNECYFEDVSLDNFRQFLVLNFKTEKKCTFPLKTLAKSFPHLKFIMNTERKEESYEISISKNFNELRS